MSEQIVNYGEHEQSAFEYLFGEETRVHNEIKDQGFALSELPLWLFDRDALKVQPRQVYRLDLGKKRYYYDFADKLFTVPRFYISMTSSVANPLFLETSEQFIEYQASFTTKEEMLKALDRAKDYGIFGHILYAEFMRKKQLWLDSIRELAFEYAERNKLDYDNRSWVKRAKRDIIAIEKWQKEHNVRPVAVELVLTSPRLGLGTAVDLICEMDWGSGQNGKILKNDKNIQRVTAIADWKTGKGFYNTSAMQLEGCKMLVNENFPKLGIDKLINIRFEGTWREAKCVMKEQTAGAMQTGACTEDGRPMTLFELEWERYKATHPNYNNPQDFDEVTGYVDLHQSDTYKFNPRNPRDIVVEKHRKY